MPSHYKYEQELKGRKAKPKKKKAKANIKKYKARGPTSQGSLPWDVTDVTVKSRTRGGHSDAEKKAAALGHPGADRTAIVEVKRPATAKQSGKIQATRFIRKAGATDVAGTAKRKPTTARGKGRKTVVKGDPVARRTPKKRTPRKSSRFSGSSM